MKLTLATLLVAALAASATPAAACGVYRSFGQALADDTYPPGETALPYGVQEEVIARQGMGLSLAGFYNDPALALAGLYYAPPPCGAYGLPPPGQAFFGPGPAPVVDYGYAPPLPHGPRVVVGPYGRGVVHGRAYGPGRYIY